MYLDYSPNSLTRGYKALEQVSGTSGDFRRSSVEFIKNGIGRVSNPDRQLLGFDEVKSKFQTESVP